MIKLLKFVKWKYDTFFIKVFVDEKLLNKKNWQCKIMLPSTGAILSPNFMATKWTASSSWHFVADRRSALGNKLR